MAEMIEQEQLHFLDVASKELEVYHVPEMQQLAVPPHH